MKNRITSTELTKRTLTEEFEEAEVFSSETERMLNEVERFFAEELVSKGMEVRFNDLHILVKGESNTVFSHLRSNLPIDD